MLIGWLKISLSWEFLNKKSKIWILEKLRTNFTYECGHITLKLQLPMV